MLTKYGRYYADWEDEHGKRHRKSFPNKPAALRFQTRQRNLVASKKARPTTSSRPSSKRGRVHGRNAAKPMQSAKASRGK